MGEVRLAALRVAVYGVKIGYRLAAGEPSPDEYKVDWGHPTFKHAANLGGTLRRLAIGVKAAARHTRLTLRSLGGERPE